jgi:hypothetical protein
MQDTLKTILKLGHDKVYAHFSDISKALILSPDKDYSFGNSETFLMMPVRGVDFNLGAEDVDFERSIECYFDFNDNEIHNADGSVAEFKMKYDDDTVLEAKYIRLFNKVTKKSELPITDNILSLKNELRATDLETDIIVKDVPLKNGIYSLRNKFPEITIEAIEDFPKRRKEADIEFEFKINADVLEHYIDKLVLSTSRDDLRPVMTGILIHHTVDNKLFLVSTDAHSLLKINITKYVSMPVYDKELKFILPTNFITDYFDVVDNEDVTVKCNITNIFISSLKVDFITRAIDGNYPNYDAVLRDVSTDKVTFDLEEVRKCFNSKESKDYIKKMNADTDNDTVNVLNVGESLFFVVTKGSGRSINIVDEKEFCKTNLKASKETKSHLNESLFLMMPVLRFNEEADFTVSTIMFDKMLKTIEDSNLEMYYEPDKPNRAYMIPIDAIDFKTTTKEHKIKEQKPKKVKASDILEAVETLELLRDISDDKDKKEIEEAIEILKMLNEADIEVEKVRDLSWNDLQKQYPYQDYYVANLEIDGILSGKTKTYAVVHKKTGEKSKSGSSLYESEKIYYIADKKGNYKKTDNPYKKEEIVNIPFEDGGNIKGNDLKFTPILTPLS